VVKKIAPQPGPRLPRKPSSREKKPEAPAGPPAYEPEGKRDPFVSFVKSDAQKVKEDQSAVPPLQRYELGELKMVGVIWARAGLRPSSRTPRGKGTRCSLETASGVPAGW
jgi:Tfp pilus assembly protein PilP